MQLCVYSSISYFCCRLDSSSWGPTYLPNTPTPVWNAARRTPGGYSKDDGHLQGNFFYDIENPSILIYNVNVNMLFETTHLEVYIIIGASLRKSNNRVGSDPASTKHEVGMKENSLLSTFSPRWKNCINGIEQLKTDLFLKEYSHNNTVYYYHV